MKKLTEDEVWAVYGRIGQHDPAQLNAVARAVEEVQGFTALTVRYAIAILALEALATGDAS